MILNQPRDYKIAAKIDINVKSKNYIQKSPKNIIPVKMNQN